MSRLDTQRREEGREHEMDHHSYITYTYIPRSSMMKPFLNFKTPLIAFL
jgi:hypothetical protein